MTIEYGRYTLGIEPEGAAAITDVGKYIVVHETRSDGATKIALDIFNSNAPPAANARFGMTSKLYADVSSRNVFAVSAIPGNNCQW